MKKILVFAVMVAFIVVIFGMPVIAAASAPNSGDCIPDGSGFDNGAYRDEYGAPNSGDGIPDGSGYDKGADRDEHGAPNSGDGIPDGSGW